MTTNEIMRLVDTYAKEYGLDYREPRYEEARAAVLAAVESMSRDAERYRWLRMQGNSNLYEFGNPCNMFRDDFTELTEEEYAVERDKWVDAALGETK